MDGISILAYAVTAVLGGGLFKGIEALIKGFSEAREKKVLGDSIGAKTPAEIESVSVATMSTALESAQARITSLEGERKLDRDYYQGRIKELSDQLASVRKELTMMEARLGQLLEETQGNGKGGPR